ncbi:MAG TPA: site-specific tyrosine recombinase XerD [Propionibacteriaceae bacterium]|nr:site-specific tyrosine recombinase XerD [Propionibacteriaceae bacterium]
MPSMVAAVQSYLDHLVVERGLSAHTIGAYRRDLHRYADYLAERGVTEPTGVTATMINEYAMRLREGVPGADGEGWAERPLGPASVARAVVAVRSLHRFLLGEGVTADDPAEAVRPPQPPRRLPKALSVAQVQAMLDVPATDTELGLRDAALLELLYGTGLRISEAVALDVDEIDRAVRVEAGQPAPSLRVLGKGSKERIVPVGSYARAAVAAYLVRSRPALARRGAGTPALFLNARGGRLSRQSAWSMLQDVAARAGISTDVSPHTLRHSFATHLLDGGADVRVVQELLGHASVTTTQIYTLVTVDHLREVYLSSHPRAR